MVINSYEIFVVMTIKVYKNVIKFVPVMDLIKEAQWSAFNLSGNAHPNNLLSYGKEKNVPVVANYRDFLCLLAIIPIIYT